MLDHKNRQAALLAEMDERPADVFDDGRLDAFGRFVEDKELRPGDQSARDSELLLLTPGEIAAASAQHIGESGKQAEYLVVNGAFNPRAGCEAGHQIFAHRE